MFFLTQTMSLSSKLLYEGKTKTILSGSLSCVATSLERPKGYLGQRGELSNPALKLVDKLSDGCLLHDRLWTC